jgi:hypothetical protein
MCENILPYGKYISLKLYAEKLGHGYTVITMEVSYDALNLSAKVISLRAPIICLHVTVLVSIIFIRGAIRQFIQCIIP